MRRVFIGTMKPIRGSTCITHLWFHLYYQSAEFNRLSTKSCIISNKIGCPSLYSSVELWSLSAQNWLRASNGWYILSRSQVLDRIVNVKETVYRIFIESTRRFFLQSQIQIKIQMGWKVIPLSLLQLSIICILKKSQ